MPYTIRPYQVTDYDQVVRLLVDHYRKAFMKAFDTDQEFFEFLRDIEVVPRSQPEGFYVAEDEEQIIGALCLRWKAITYPSTFELIQKSVRYRDLKVYRRVLGMILFDHDVDEDECYIQHFVVRSETHNQEVALDLLRRGEQYADDNHYRRLTMDLPSGNIHMESVLRSMGFKTKKLRNSRLIRYFLGDGSYRQMVKKPGFKPQQLTIGMFTDTYMPQINGVATSISILANELENMGHKVYIITIRDRVTSISFDGKVLRVPGFRVIKGTDYRLANIIVSTQVSKIVKEMDLDVIHTHTEFAIGLLGTYFAKTDHIPQIHTYHTMYDDYIHYTTNFKPFQKVALGFIRTYVKDFTDVCKKVIVPTEKTRQVLSNYGVTTEMTTVPTGIDFSKFIVDEGHEKVLELKRRLGFTEDDFVCLNIGRVSKEKNVEAIIDNVMTLLPDQPRLKMVIIGDGPDYKRLVEKTQAYKDSIVFLGRVPWEEIGYYYKLGDVFAVASRFETQGLTIIEALSSGLPVICSDDQAFLNVVEDGSNGLIFNRDDQIGDKLTAIMDESLYESMLSNTKNSVVKYSAEYFAETVESEYLSIIE